jgi:polysaccharide biosynthesis/export protein
VLVVVLSACLGGHQLHAQTNPPAQAARGSAATEPVVTPVTPPLPADYVIGAEDVLAVIFWRDETISAEVVVRPDGKISLPLLNDVHAAGLTPAQLREVLDNEARRYVEEPNATVIVREINSRKVFITGQVARPGPYPLTSDTTVLQLIAMAGGLLEYANDKNIFVLRNEGGRSVTFPFNHRDVVRRRNLGQNILLRPGDTVVVP